MSVYNSSHTGLQLDTIADNAILRAQLLDMVYPVGSIYISVNDTNPANLFGGVWQRIEDTFLLAAGSTYTAGDTGGKAEYVADDMPAHTHTRGTMEIEGKAAASYEQTGGFQNQNSGAFYTVDSLSYFGWGQSGYDNDNRGLGFKASRSWTGETSQSGLNATATIMPPYLAVYVWKRVADSTPEPEEEQEEEEGE